VDIVGTSLPNHARVYTTCQSGGAPEFWILCTAVVGAARMDTCRTSLAKWHILWLAPLVAILPTALLLYYASHVQRGPGMVVWVFAFVMLLAFMTFWVALSPSALPTSWLLGCILGGLRVTWRLLTNRVAARTGAVPKWLSLLSFTGFLGATGAFLWSLTSEGWAAAVPMLFFGYLLSTFVPSAWHRIPGLEVK
jgi:hypothetical protein